MDKKFIGYRKKTKDEINELWKNALFTFDTNVLLNLYRYSETTRSDIYGIVENLNNRIFLTYQVAYEFNKNRFEVINEIIKKNKQFLKDLEKIKSDITSKNSAPFLSDLLSTKFNDVIKEIEFEINSTIEKYESLFNDDDIYKKITQLFENKILENFTADELKKIKVEGEDRYKLSIPPGYLDAKKEENKYGDFIIWKEIINQASKQNKSILLISDEQKLDWLWKLKDDKIIGPRPELVQEFNDLTNENFHIYNSLNFIRFGSEYFQGSIDENTINEISKVSSETNSQELSTYLKSLSSESIEELLENLTPREADVLSLNLGLVNYTPTRIKEIALMHDLPTLEIIKVKVRAMRKLKDILNK